MLLWLCAIIGLAVTIAGTGAHYTPYLDLANQVQPLTFLALLTVSALSFRGQRYWLKRLSAVGLLINAGSTAAPLFSTPVSGAASAGTSATIVSVNLFDTNLNFDAIAASMTSRDPDIMIFAEYTLAHDVGLRSKFSQHFPYSVSCKREGMRCDIAIFSKWPLQSDVEYVPYESGTPGLASAVATAPSGKKFRLVGLHLHYPFRPALQAADITWLIAQKQKWKEPLILAGDFNLSPWTSLMKRLQHETGLVRHGTFQRSWPKAIYAVRTPFVLLDNILTTPDIRAVSFETGPPLGSDHLPVIATVVLP